MRCRSCGQSFPDGQTHCPECGAEVDFIHSSNVSSNLGIPSGMAADGHYDSFRPNNMSNFNNIPSGMFPDNNGMNNNMNSMNSNFNNGMNNNMNSMNNNFNNGMNNNMNSMNNNFNNGMNNNMNSVNNNFNNGMNNFGDNGVQFNNQNMMMDGNNQTSNGGKNGIFGDFTTKIPWIPIAIGLVVIMVIGLILVPTFEKHNLKLYEGSRYAFQYNGSRWTLDEKEENMTLNYEDEVSKFVLNGIVTYSSLNFEVKDAESKKILYDTLYTAWSDIENGKLTGKGTDTFRDLSNGAMYARINYKMTNSNNEGAFYIVVNKDYDLIISFSSLCTPDSYEDVDKDIMEMIHSMSYKAAAIASTTSIVDYTKFRVQDAFKYHNEGYMSYFVPDCWNYDDINSAKFDYKSSVFKFSDSKAYLNVKAITAYDDLGNAIGTNYDKIKADVANTYGAIKVEDSIVVNDKVWYILITPDYISNNESYHNEVYFTLSDSNLHYYYLEVSVPNWYDNLKLNYLRESVEYILKSAQLERVNE